MGCPIHVWAPIMAGLLPFARVARDRLRTMQMRRRDGTTEGPRELKRWAPVQPHRTPDTAE